MSETDAEFLLQGARALGVELSREAIDLLLAYCDEVIFWNAVAGITSYSKKKDIFAFMILDSLAGAKLIDRLSLKRLLDAGTGGGFPGIPLRIARPHLELTLVDSSSKKVDFLKHIAGRLKLKDVHIESGRIPKLAHGGAFGGQFEGVVARALAPLPKLLEMTVPLIETGGLILAWKGPALERELREARDLLQTLNVRVEKVLKYGHHLGQAGRKIVVIRKLAAIDQANRGKAAGR